MCLDCLVYKNLSGKTPSKRPFQVIYVNHFCTFETSANRKKYQLVVVDNLFKYFLLYPTSSKHADGMLSQQVTQGAKSTYQTTSQVTAVLALRPITSKSIIDSLEFATHLTLVNMHR